MRKLGVVILFFGLFAGCTIQPGTVELVSQAKGISVSGEGKISATPDLAILRLGVEARAPTAEEARQQAAKGMEAIMAALKGLGIADKDIQTQRLSITPFSERQGERTVRGFLASNLVQVKVRNLDLVGKAVDGAVAAARDLVRVEGVNFTIEDPSTLQTQAREKALADARAKAEAFAKGTGVSLGRPLSISEGGFRVPAIPVALGRGGELAAEAPTPISPGEMEIVLTVQIVYAIQPPPFDLR